jgi:hypothetical protein
MTCVCPILPYDQAVHEADRMTNDRETNLTGITRYVCRLANGDHVVATFEEYTFCLPTGSTIVHTGEWE